MKDISLPKEAGVLCVSSRYIYIYLFIYLYFDFAKAFDSVSQDLILKNSKISTKSMASCSDLLNFTSESTAAGFNWLHQLFQNTC